MVFPFQQGCCLYFTALIKEFFFLVRRALIPQDNGQVDVLRVTLRFIRFSIFRPRLSDQPPHEDVDTRYPDLSLLVRVSGYELSWGNARLFGTRAAFGTTRLLVVGPMTFVGTATRRRSDRWRTWGG